MKELFSMIGKIGTYTANGFPIKVKVLDVKTVYGVDKLLVGVDYSSFTKWINKDSFREESTSETKI